MPANIKLALKRDGLFYIHFWCCWLRQQELLTYFAMTHHIGIESLLFTERATNSQQWSQMVSFFRSPKNLLSWKTITPHINLRRTALCKNQPDGMTVAEIQSRDDLPEELPGLFGSQPALLHQVVKQLSSWHMLQHQVPVGIRGQQCDLKLSSLSDRRRHKRNTLRTINLNSGT